MFDDVVGSSNRWYSKLKYRILRRKRPPPRPVAARYVRVRVARRRVTPHQLEEWIRRPTHIVLPHLPEELICHILDFFPALREAHQHTYGERRIRKYGLTSCSLVCYYWAKRMRPLLFESLHLRGPDDVDQLLEFLKSSPVRGLQPSTHIRRITYLKFDNRIPPWLRLNSVSKLTPEARFHIIIDGSRDFRLDGDSIMRCLPRTLPPSALPPCETMSLAGARFRRRTHLTALANTFPMTREYAYEMNLNVDEPHWPVTTPSRALLRQLERGQPNKVCFRTQDATSLQDPSGLAAQLSVVFTAVAPRERLKIRSDVWESIGAALLALVPPKSFLSRLIVDNSQGERIAVALSIKQLR